MRFYGFYGMDLVSLESVHWNQNTPCPSAVEAQETAHTLRPSPYGGAGDKTHPAPSTTMEEQHTGSFEC